MNTLIIDNIDSFVYNLEQYAGMLGENVFVIQKNASMEYVDAFVNKKGIDHIIISPGPGHPEDAQVSNTVIERYAGRIPILGVCLGHQCIGMLYGGRIRHAKNLMHGKTSEIIHDEKGIFRGIGNPLTATRYHSLVVDEKDLPNYLIVTARSRDDGEIMALRHMDHPVYGLQFHPESILTKEGMKLMKNFLQEKI